MADNTLLNLGVGGDTIASDDIGGIKHQRVKVEYGADGSATDASIATPLPVGFPTDPAKIDLTTTVLLASAEYISQTYDTTVVGPWTNHVIVASHSGTHIFEISTNGTTWYIVDQDGYIANEVFNEEHYCSARYHRARFVNGATTQTSFMHSVVPRHSGVAHAIGLRSPDNAVIGDKTNNVAAPSDTAHEVLGALVQTTAPSYTHGTVAMPRITPSGDTAVTMDGEVVQVSGPLTDAQLRATPVPVSGTVTASNTAGDVAHDGVDSGNPLGVGGIARTAFTSVQALDRVKAIYDLQGRQVIRQNAPRGLRMRGAITLTTTTETTLITANAGMFHDLTKVIISNTSAVAVRVDFRDVTAGAVIMSIYAPAGQTVGFTDSSDPIEQTTVNTAWTAQLSAAATDVRIFAQAIMNIP